MTNIEAPPPRRAKQNVLQKGPPPEIVPFPTEKAVWKKTKMTRTSTSHGQLQRATSIHQIVATPCREEEEGAKPAGTNRGQLQVGLLSADFVFAYFNVFLEK